MRCNAALPPRLTRHRRSAPLLDEYEPYEPPREAWVAAEASARRAEVLKNITGAAG